MRTSYREQASYRSTPYYTYHPPRHAARPDSRTQPQDIPYKSPWPPSPSVEEESTSLARELPWAGSIVTDGEAPWRGTVDQCPIIEEIEQPNDERRFVLLSDRTEHHGPTKDHAASQPRRKSYAERGHMPRLKTDLDDDPPLFPKRTSTPYAYTTSQKESLAPSAGEYFLSPETTDPSASSIPRSVPNNRHVRDQNAKPPSQIPVHPTTTSSRPPSPVKNREEVFEDSGSDSDVSLLRTERKPARYSFVKSDLQKEDLRTNVLDSKAQSERRKRGSFSQPDTRRKEYVAGGSGSNSSSGSKQHTPIESPKSSSSSLNGEHRKFKPAPFDTRSTKGSKYASSRSASPRFDEKPSPPRSPRLPPRRSVSPVTSRPSSRSGRPASPPSSAYIQPQYSPRVPITEADWNSTYPPTTERSRPVNRPERYDTMPVPTPKINVKSPSPARQRKTETLLPYPVDDRPVDAFMPPEEQYQHDHSYDSYTPITASPRPNLLDSPVLGKPHERSLPARPRPSSRQNTADEVPISPRVRSNSVRSQISDNGGRRERKKQVSLSPGGPLPSCPRTEPSSRYNDWYTLEGCSTFDLCPSCYDGVFADTPFSRYFSQTCRFERPVERICDFSSAWMRLAWLLTIQQRRQSPDLLYNLAKITERERECPGDHAFGANHIAWYGISDPRDGVHVTNFAICPCDSRMIEELFPSMIGYFTRIPITTSSYVLPPAYTCSLRVKSRRFPKYLDLLVKLDAEAQALNQHPHISRFVQLARENAFKAECQRDKPLVHKAWHFIPALPELTVCQECFEELIWPHLISSSASPFVPSTIPKLFNRTIQPVPGEDPDLGSSCGLYSPRTRKIWERAVKDEDFGYLERKVLERKRAEAELGRARRDILTWMDGLVRGTYEWEKAKLEIKENEEAWSLWE